MLGLNTTVWLLYATMFLGQVWAGETQWRSLRKEVVVQAPLAVVWHAWTTAEGLKQVAGTARVELRICGPYEWFLELDPDDHGRRGK